MTEAEKNRSSLIAYFESGSKDNDQKLGVEVEHFIIVSSDGDPFHLCCARLYSWGA